MDTQEKERELKNTLTPEEFQRICTNLCVRLHINSKTQINHFFDTKEYLFDSSDYTLRAREKKGWELTFKENNPHGVGRLETNHIPLTTEEKEILFTKGTIPAGPVFVRLQQLSLDDKLPHFIYHGQQDTKRIVVKNDHGEYMLDFSLYLGTVDYEIEFEMDDSITDEEGEQYFTEFLKSLGIDRKPAIGKRRRFFKRKRDLLIGK